MAFRYASRVYAYGYSYNAAVECDKHLARANRILGKIDKRIIRRILAKQAITTEGVR